MMERNINIYRKKFLLGMVWKRRFFCRYCFSVSAELNVRMVTAV